MRPLSRALSATILLCALTPPALAQTYTPHRIVIEGPAGMDQADILRTAGLKPGTPITKEQIEAALSRLGDTGDFTDLAYTVNADALTLKLTPSAAALVVPVRYVNFVWWTPAELTPLIQARVPLYQGQLPLTGNLTDQVEAALVAMLKEKGIDAEVTPIEAFGANAIALSISRPAILLGDIHVEGSLPVVAPILKNMQAGFAGQEFDLQVTSTAITRNVTDLYQNAGYLDAATGPATFAPPRKDADRYFIDATVTVHPGEPYRIRQLNFTALPPLTRSDLEKAAAVKIGDPAGVFPLQHAADSLAHAYTLRGFLDATAHNDCPKDPSTHTVDCTFTVNPGNLYHLSAVAASTLPPRAQSAIAHDSKLASGVIADQEALQEVLRILSEQNLSKSVKMSMNNDHIQHTTTIVLVSLSPKH